MLAPALVDADEVLRVLSCRRFVPWGPYLDAQQPCTQICSSKLPRDESLISILCLAIKYISGRALIGCLHSGPWWTRSFNFSSGCFSPPHSSSPLPTLHLKSTTAMDSEIAQTAIEGPKQFVKDGVAFINRCTKPDRKGNRVGPFSSDATHSSSSGGTRSRSSQWSKAPVEWRC